MIALSLLLPGAAEAKWQWWRGGEGLWNTGPWHWQSVWNLGDRTAHRWQVNILLSWCHMECGVFCVLCVTHTCVTQHKSIFLNNKSCPLHCTKACKRNYGKSIRSEFIHSVIIRKCLSCWGGGYRSWTGRQIVTGLTHGGRQQFTLRSKLKW